MSAHRQALFVSPNIYVVRNWLASGLADAAAAELGLTPVFLTPFADATVASPGGRAFRNLQVASNGRGEPDDFPRVLALVRYLRHRLFALEFANGSLQTMELAERRDWPNVLGRATSASASRAGALRRVLRSLALHHRPRHAVDVVFERERFELVIVGSPGVQLLDHLAMNAAQRHRAPVHCIVSSWDNMTSRGPLMAWPERLFVWNRHMAVQARDIHQFPSARVDVAGPLQFSQYVAPVTAAEREALGARLGLQPGQPYLTFMTGQHLPEYEAEDVQALLEALEGTALRDLPLVVRVHPQGDVRPIAAIVHPRLVIDRAPAFAATGHGAARFDLSEVRSMAALLAGARIVFSSWATTALLEACVFDRPIVQLRWMDAVPRQVPAQADKIRRLERYLHLAPFDGAGCRLFCDAPAALPETLRRLEIDAAALAAGRARAVAELASPPLGAATGRIIEVLRRTCPA